MLSFVIMLFFIVFMVLIINPAIRMMTKGKMLVYIIEDDRVLTSKLKKPSYNNEYILDGEGAYEIFPDYIGFTTYPKGMLPSFFQTVVPYSMYHRDDPIPMLITNSVLKPVTSKEVKLGLEPHFLTGLARQSDAGTQQTRLQKMMPILMLGGIAISVVILLALYSKFGSLSSAINALQKAIGG